MPDKKKERQQVNEITVFPFQLVDIRIFELYAERCEPGEEEAKVSPLALELRAPEDTDTSKEFTILLIFSSGFPLDEGPVCKIQISIEGLFAPVVDSEKLKPEVIEKFITNDALVLFWPYLRQYLHELSTKMRLGVPPLPVIDPRSLVISKEQEE